MKKTMIALVIVLGLAFMGAGLYLGVNPAANTPYGFWVALFGALLAVLGLADGLAKWRELLFPEKDDQKKKPADVTKPVVTSTKQVQDVEDSQDVSQDGQGAGLSQRQHVRNSEGVRQTGTGSGEQQQKVKNSKNVSQRRD